MSTECVLKAEVEVGMGSVGVESPLPFWLPVVVGTSTGVVGIENSSGNVTVVVVDVVVDVVACCC
ncbi:hypothetical protein SAMD00019534_050560 [Acytostelium subglobosum LB1]|uniref:hypothetical protein n=1 Tax=Acytostelium subglobosum LB1 TaxID=1410327 RepID=UPI0006451E47|nr:hypothetical protein SAMD00019534_050560 [Acytostelium subglobosum LB1]GAM21881.1 hypothetical protein SAMD00019534_050560 [Acytostelium subglobosum LB1]|eukprot:XP_012754981.1 hypothetical protein SAMD00019534_050560 [Acytostelium subglobosum LB1]